MRPMLATKGDHVPTGEGWTHEVKWDGVRILADQRTAGGAAGGEAPAVLSSRNENVVTPAWPEVAAGPGRDLLADGEIIAFDATGRPDFRVLAERMHVRDPRAVARLVASVPVVYMVFDLLRLDGHDLTRLPLTERRRALDDVDLAGTAWQVPPAYDDGPALHRATREQRLEGVVSKRLASPYAPGVRSPHWLKFAHRHRGSYVVGGWRPQEGTTDRLAALLVGEVTPEGLVYRGRVGSGIAARNGPLLQRLLEPLHAEASPFVDEVPRLDARGTTWVEPRVVVDVDTHGGGALPPGARLRQPSFQGVRTDMTPEDLAGEEP